MERRPLSPSFCPARRWSAKFSAALLTCLVVVLIWLPSISLGESPAGVNRVSGSLSAVLHRRGDITLRETSLPDALMALSETWGVNIAAGDAVVGQVTGVFNDAPLHEILESILQSNGYTYRPVGKGLIVTPADQGVAAHPLFETATIPLAVAHPEEVLDSVRLLASPQGRVQAIPSANSLIVFDFPDQVANIRQFVEQLDAAAKRSISAAASAAGQVEVTYFRSAIYRGEVAARCCAVDAIG